MVKRLKLFCVIPFFLGTAVSSLADITAPVADPERLEITVLDQGMQKPLIIEQAPDGRIFFIELHGKVRIWHPGDGRVTEAAEFEVYDQQESGLLGLALDPEFEKNQWLYLKYSHPVHSEEWISRFTMHGDLLDKSSETLIIKFATNRDKENCCHEAGSIAFGPKGCLFISAGDNTNPFEDSKGYAPIDERDGRAAFDAQRSSGNTMDLRGGISRIRPLPEGGYEIPEGNLFPERGAEEGLPEIYGRPEVYVMGCRNPWRISIDQKTGILYFGDVGPDAGRDLKERGARGYDEVNQVRKAGFFGWPYFIGDNLAYYDWDFEADATGPMYDVSRPVNRSPNNTGSQILPPAQAAWIHYPAGNSETFPVLKSGGRTACAGPVYHFDESNPSPRKLPKYYDNCLFIYEWSRHWIMAVHLDDQSNRVRIEPFLETHSFKRPVDMKLGHDGELYILEYGDTWGFNDDSRLLRVDYNRGNRAPLAKVSATGNIGPSPLKVSFSSEGTVDADRGDTLRYEWRTKAGGEIVSIEKNPSLRFEENGVYNVELTVTDSHGGKSVVRTPTLVGNSLPELKFEYPRDGGFFHWNRDLRFKVSGYDLEDDESMGKITVRGGQQASDGPSERDPIGLKLMRGSDCFNCHAFSHKIVGPSILDIAKRYEDDSEALDRAAQRVIDGSTTVWSDVPMLPHPQHSIVETRQMVAWILRQKEGDVSMVLVDSFAESNLNIAGQPSENAPDTFVLTASYTDGGADPIGPLTSTVSVELRNARIEAESARERDGLRVADNKDGKNQKHLRSISNGDWARYGMVDLRGIGQVTCRASSNESGGNVIFLMNSKDGRILGQVEVGGTGGNDAYRDFVSEIEDPGEPFELFVTFDGPDQMMNVNWFEFQPSH
ncbi:PQQ-dependent sugar dehydrogenase [bacterium]|jgi:cytochrome c|nr:PQQ-dependent sugar dehydrogenase [bacterium]